MIDLQLVKTTFGAPDERVAASLFMKRYPLLQDVVQRLIGSGEQLPIALEEYELTLTKKAIELTPKTKPKPREQKTYLTAVVTEHMIPLIIELQSHISSHVLISHAMYPLFEMYYCQKLDTVAEKEALHEAIKLIQDVFATHGYESAKTFEVNLITHPLTSKRVLLRNVCCLAYLVKGSHCRVCPKLSETEREKLLKTPKRNKRKECNVVSR